MVRVTSVNLDVPLGTKIQDLITALIELEKILQSTALMSISLLRSQIGVNTNFCCRPSQTA